MSVPAPQIDQLLKDKQRDVSQATVRQAALDKTRTDTAAAEDKELAPLEAKTSSAITDLQAAEAKPPPAFDPPKFEPKPLIDGKDFQGLSMGLIAMALVGGVASKGNWMGVASTLNGALKGYYDGNKERAEREWQNYKTQFDAAKAKSESEQKEFADILQNRRLTINEMFSQMRIAAAKYGREDIRAAAEQKSIDQLWQRVQAADTTLAQISDKDQRQRAGLDATLNRQTAAEKALDDKGEWFVQQTALGGNMKYVQMLQSRFGGILAADTFNKIGAALQASGLDPRTITEEQLNLMVQKTAQQNATNRQLAVERLTESLKPLESELTMLVTKVNGKGLTAANATFNKIKSQLGDEDLAELKTLMGSVGRQYVEAVTMPGSNAQLHASAQQWVDGQFDANTNIANVQGTLKAMNLEIASTKKALENQIKTSQGTVTGQGPTLPVPGAPPPPAAPPPAAAAHQPFADPAKEQRYQEWKRAQPQPTQ
jgi:hypothetical protein